MVMDPQPAAPSKIEGAPRLVLEREFQALRALCQDTGQRAFWHRGTALLADYRFRDPLHQLVFDSLRELDSAAPDNIRDQLLQRLTVKGFPDVEIEHFFHGHAVSADQAIAIMEQLKLSAHPANRPGSSGL